MRGCRSGGTGDKVNRSGNVYYLNFLEDLFERNQQSPYPVSRQDFFNISQEFWHEFQIRCEKYGVEEVYQSMKLDGARP